MNESSTASMPVRVLSWIGAAISILVLLGFVLAAILIYQLKFGEADQATGLTFLVTATWLLLLGAASAVFGGLGVYLGRGNEGVARRSRRTLIMGIIALVIGGLFGVNPFV